MKHSQLGAYLELKEHLEKAQYNFICPSPESQDRVCRSRTNNSPQASGNTLADVFGWSFEIQADHVSRIIPPQLLQRLRDSEIIYESRPQYFASSVRVSNLYLPHLNRHGEDRAIYYVHSAFPVTMESAFFGPDTYLFLDFLVNSQRRTLPATRTIVDVCCGPGAGAVHMARNFPDARSIGLDLNPKALELAEVNAALANVNVEFFYSDLYSSLPGVLNGTKVDIIVADPPYIATSIGDSGPVPVYADGGKFTGLEISMRIIKEGYQFLKQGGLVLMFTAVTISAADPGQDPFLAWLSGQPEYKLLDYRIYFPDIWSEEIGKGAYVDAARIQVVGIVLQRQ